MRGLKLLFILYLMASLLQAQAQTPQRVVDIPTRPGATQRMILLSPPDAKATVVLIPGGHGGLQLSPDGSMKWGAGNFLVRTRQLFADQGLIVAVIDAPSDRQTPPFLGGFRQRAEHAADLKAVIAWLRENAKLPVWIVGTSRGTQSTAYVATELEGSEGPDGIVLKRFGSCWHVDQTVATQPSPCFQGLQYASAMRADSALSRRRGARVMDHIQTSSGVPDNSFETSGLD